MRFANRKNTQSGPDAATGSVRVLLAAERPAEWQAFFAPLSVREIRIETSDSAFAALAALQQAAQARDPYRVVMLAPMIQGMSAEILGAAIRNDRAHREAVLALLGDGGEAQRCLPAGFHTWIDRTTPPQAVASMIAALRSAAAPHPESFPEMRVAVRRILVADDNPVNRQVTASMLEKLGYEVDVAGDGLQVVEMHGRARYDLLLMDCDMPQLDGYQATLRIRAAEGAACRTPVIALSASMQESKRDKCLASGMDDFMVKPIRPQALKEVLARLRLPARTAEAQSAAAGDDELDMVRGMFGADFPELAALYQNDSPPRLAALHGAYAAGDVARIVKLAHALAGSSASIGATRMSALCGELELRARQAALDDFDRRLAAIEAEYRRVRDKLQNMRD